MEQLTLIKADVVKAFNNGDASVKKLLQDLFPDQVLSGKITDRVKTFSDACDVLGINEEDITMNLQCEALPDDVKSIMAYAKLVIICRALNEGWKPDWTNGNQWKYYPWFALSSGSGLSYHDFANDYSFSSVGSRLCLKNKELAEYIGKQFSDIYAEYMLIK